MTDEPNIPKLKQLIDFGMAVRQCDCRDCMMHVIDTIRDQFPEFSGLEVMSLQAASESDGGTIH